MRDESWRTTAGGVAEREASALRTVAGRRGSAGRETKGGKRSGDRLGPECATSYYASVRLNVWCSIQF
jgi:hypothetical protein